MLCSHREKWDLSSRLWDLQAYMEGLSSQRQVMLTLHHSLRRPRPGEAGGRGYWRLAETCSPSTRKRSESRPPPETEERERLITEEKVYWDEHKNTPTSFSRLEPKHTHCLHTKHPHRTFSTQIHSLQVMLISHQASWEIQCFLSTVLK